MFDGDGGTGRHSYWPPVMPIAQGVIFKLLGLTQFTIYFQSTLLTLALLAVLLKLYRIQGCSLPQALAGGLLPFALWNIGRSYSTVRMEGYIPIVFVLFLICVIHGRKIPGIMIIAGILTGVGCLAYYTQAPSLLLACSTMLALERVKLASWLQFGLGGAAIMCVWLAWQNFTLAPLAAQLKAVGGSTYIGFHFFNNLSLGSGPNRAASGWEVLIICALTVWAALKTKYRISFAATVLVSAIPLLYITNPESLILPSVAGVAYIVSAVCNSDYKRLLTVRSVAVVCVIITVAKSLLLAVTAAVQWEGRNYRTVSRLIAMRVPQDSIVGFSQAAWLALRASGVHEIHFMVPSGSPQAYVSRSIILRDSKNWRHFSHFIIDPRQEEELRRDYPVFATAIENGSLRKIEEVKPRYAPLPWAKVAPYWLVIYENSGWVGHQQHRN